MPEEPRVERAQQPQVEAPPTEPPEEDWLEDELPPDDQQGIDWRRAGVIAAFIAVSVAIAVFFVWTYLLPSATRTGL